MKNTKNYLIEIGEEAQALPDVYGFPKSLVLLIQPQGGTVLVGNEDAQYFRAADGGAMNFLCGKSSECYIRSASGAVNVAVMIFE